MTISILPLIHEIKNPNSALELFSLFRYRSYSFFLDSSLIHPKYGRYSYFGFDPFLIIQSKGKEVKVIQNGRMDFSDEPVLTVLKDTLSRYDIPPMLDIPPFLGGGVGFFSYDYGRQLEILPEIALDDMDSPDCLFGFYDIIFSFDHLKNKAWLISSGFPETTATGRRRRSKERLKEVLDILKSVEKNKTTSFLTKPNETLFHTSPIQSNFTMEQYISMVTTAQEYIATGDIYQVNLSQRFQTAWENSPWDLYLRLRHFNPAPFSAYFTGSDFSILSSSPELFLKLSQRWAETRPVKGTRPRGATPSEDMVFRNELMTSTKDKAELVMIVDLERNDLGKTCEYGSIHVDNFPELEPYATVWHLVGSVYGKLRMKTTHLDCLRACFPGGSITGAPKIRSMQLIEELEPVRRGIYTGSIGYLGFNKESSFNIAIRTMVLKNNILYFHSGGAITSDSNPESEYEETLQKSKALFEAIKEIPQLALT